MTQSNPGDDGDAGARLPWELHGRLAQEWEHYDKLIWQVTATLLTFLTAVVVLVSSTLNDPLMRALAFGMATIVIWALRTGLVKHAYFLKVRAFQIEQIERASLGGRAVQRWTLRSAPPEDRPLLGEPVYAADAAGRRWPLRMLHVVYNPEGYSALKCILFATFLLMVVVGFASCLFLVLALNAAIRASA